MIYIFSLLTGLANGFFASGAGQILVFYLIYILKEETHVSRLISICSIGIVTLFTIIRYLNFAKVEITNVVITILCGFIFGFIGSKIMQKIPSKVLNIVSGLLIVVFSIYNLVVILWN